MLVMFKLAAAEFGGQQELQIRTFWFGFVFFKHAMNRLFYFELFVFACSTLA